MISQFSRIDHDQQLKRWCEKKVGLVSSAMIVRALLALDMHVAYTHMSCTAVQCNRIMIMVPYIVRIHITQTPQACVPMCVI